MAEKMTLTEKLMHIQTEMKAPKNMYNSFGKYKYRNAEGIQEALKPYLAKYNCTLTIQNDVKQVGDRIYFYSYTYLKDCDSDEQIGTQAMAREDSEKKGMDSAQLSGATISYANKYCLSNLFLLDDTKDADSEEFHEENKGKANQREAQKSAPTVDKITSDQLLSLREYADRLGVSVEALKEVAGVDGLEKCTHAQYEKLMAKLKATENSRKGN